MKKMVCEICGSQKILKQNGIFVCQECGTEYSLEEAKSLLKEIEKEERENPSGPNLKIVKSDANRREIVEMLSCWLKCVSIFENADFWLENSCGISSTGGLVTNDFVVRAANAKKLEIGNLQSTDFCGSNPQLKRFANIYRGRSIKEDLISLLKCDKIVSWTIYKLRSCDPQTNVFYSTDGECYWPITLMSCMGDEPYEFLIRLAATGKTYKAKTRRIIDEGIFFPKLTVFWADTSGEDGFNITKTIEIIEGYLEKFKERHAELQDYYNKHFDTAISTFKGAEKAIGDLEAQFFLPEKYRSSSSIAKLLDIFADGRADTWKEGLNLFEQERRMDIAILTVAQVSRKLDVIDRRLGTVNEKLDGVSLRLAGISANIEALYSQACYTSEALTYIALDTRWIALK